MRKYCCVVKEPLHFSWQGWGNHITPQCLSVLCVLPAVYDLIEVFIVVGYTNEILGIVAMLSNTQTLKSHCLLRSRVKRFS